MGKPDEHVIGITLTLDKSRVTPYDEIVAKELVSSTTKASVIRINHHAVLIGGYDVGLKAMRNYELNCFQNILNAEAAGLPSSESFSHPWFNMSTKDQKGWSFKGRPKRLGVYLITATWWLRDDHRSLSSNPVILIVEPPVNSKGEPILKPEWLGPPDGP